MTTESNTESWEASLDARTSALAAKLNAGELAPLDVSSAPVEDDEPAAAEPEEPAAPPKPVAKVPLPKGLEPEDDDDEPAPAEGKDLSRMLAAERDLRRKARGQTEARTAFERERAAFQQQQASFQQQQQQVQALLQRFSTPEGILEHFESLGTEGGKRLAQYIVEAQDPHKQAVAEARKTLTPIEQQLQELQKRLDSMTAERTYQEAVNQFTGYVRDVTEAYGDKLPYVARAFSVDADYLVRRADELASEMHAKRNPYGPPLQHDDIVVELERRLAREARLYIGQESSGRTSDEPAESAQSQPRARARVQAKPLTNRSVGGRTMAAHETPEQALEKMSLDDRVAAAERRRLGR